MQVLYTHFKKRKPKKLTAAQRELEAEWEKINKKYAPKTKLSTKVQAWTPPSAYVRDTPKLASLDTGFVECTKKDAPKYTGSEMMGVGQLHKSNAIPIFRKSDAEDLAKMRR